MDGPKNTIQENSESRGKDGRSGSLHRGRICHFVILCHKHICKFYDWERVSCCIRICEQRLFPVRRYEIYRIKRK